MKTILALLACFALTFVTTTSARGDVLPAEDNHVVSLNGNWRFKLEKAQDPAHPENPAGIKPLSGTPTTFEAFYGTEYQEDGLWHDMAVPSNWEMAGFSPATYDQPDNASGFFRKWIEIPGDWNGRVVKVNFDGVQNGAEIWLNGQPVKVDEGSWGRENYHESGWTAFQADLTPAVKFGEKNLLAIRVTKNTKSADLDTGDYFFLGGIHRPVTMFSLPQKHIKDFAFRTKLMDGNKAEVELIVNVSEPDAGTVSAKLEGMDEMAMGMADKNRIELSQVVSEPKLWSAEFPNLYTLSIDLKDAGGKTIEHVTRRVGIREISTEGGIFKVNGVPVKLQGICRHDVYPTLGTAINEEIWRKDITLMKAANINAIRTSHYPYGSGFYDLCDELGMYVADELPYCWCNVNDESLRPAFEQRARETVRRDLNHPSVVIWAIGNENKEGPNNGAASKVCKEMDPTRPRLSSCHNAEEADTQFDDSHYTEPKVMAAEEKKKARRATIPRIYLESPNSWENMLGADYGALDIWALVYQRTWNEIWDAPHTTGCFLWEWTDRAIADKATTKPYHVETATGVQYLKTKGIVDGFRNPRPQYFHVKMVLTPIKLDDHVEIEGSTVKLRGTNRYSFTDLSMLTTNWELVSADKAIANGSAHPAIKPLTYGEIQLELPQKELSKADVLRVSFVHPDGREVGTYQFDLKPAKATTPALDYASSAVLFPRLNLVTSKEARDSIGWKTCVRMHYQLANVMVKKTDGAAKESMAQSDLLKTPLKDVASVDADIVTAEDSTPFGAVHVDYSNGSFSYRVNWKRADGSAPARNNKKPPAGKAPTEQPFDVQEIGWAFAGAGDHFTWDRKAMWTWYPQTHIGRAHGSTTADSAHVNNTQLSRLDAFDFNSTKYDCNYATLTDSAGSGVAAVFAPEHRHQVKAADIDGGSHELIVNYHVNPPRDISANAVSDQFLNLTHGSEIHSAFNVGACGK